MDELRTHIRNQCLDHEPAFCSAACPFGLDVPDFIEKLQRGSFSAAYRTYRDAVVFPDIVANLCDAPCQTVCLRASKDASVDLPMLEHAVIANAPNRNPNRYNIPQKSKRIAVIGAGISGLTCALRLASASYQVAVYEKSDRIGGRLWNELNPKIFLEEIGREFSFVTYTLNLNAEITALEEIDADAVYIATGFHGTDFGFNPSNGPTSGPRTGVFLGGSLCSSNTVQSIADGLQAVSLIEHYLKTGIMLHPKENTGTRLILSPDKFVCASEVKPSNGQFFSAEEAILESKRCLRCSCDVCMRSCDMMAYYKRLPPRIAQDIYSTIHPSSIYGKETFAKRLMETCNQCGACKSVCPQNLDLGALIHESRKIMRKAGTQPWVFHDYWLRDMDNATNESYLAKKPKGFTKSSIVFFPGCQLGSSDVQYVLDGYDWILEKQPDAALWLSCCGVPAIWAGAEDLANKTLNKLCTDWHSMGCPEVIFACPTCKKTFEASLPEIKGRFLFQWMADSGFIPKRKLNGKAMTVFDPCASRDDPDLQHAVRTLAERAGVALSPLPFEGDDARCCSWGGHVSIANPDFVKNQIVMRSQASDLPYIAYCSNCRDIFAESNKSCVHILDLLFDLGTADRAPPDCTTRRLNRTLLKQKALLKYWTENFDLPEKNTIHLIIDDALRKKMSHDYMLVQEAAEAVAYCEKSGQYVVDTGTGDRTGHAFIGRFTHWVTYCLEEGNYRLKNAYMHRMNIQMEDTWNGRKDKHDL